MPTATIVCSIWPTPSTTHARPISTNLWGVPRAKLRRYQEFIERVLTPERAAVIQSIQSGNFNLTADLAPGLAMLNTRYLLVPGAEQPLPFNGGLGAAWFVNEVQWVNSAEEEIGAVAGLDPARTAAVNQSFEEVLGRVGNPGANVVNLTQYHPEGSTYEVSSDKGGLLVLSEVTTPWAGLHWWTERKCPGSGERPAVRLEGSCGKP